MIIFYSYRGQSSALFMNKDSALPSIVVTAANLMGTTHIIDFYIILAGLTEAVLSEA